MVPHVRTWEASAHQRTDCATCHEGPGADGIIRFQVSLAEMAYKYVTNTYYLPIAMREQMSAESCLNCHALNREMSPSGDLIVPHKNHEKVRVDCMSCHKGVVHANIAGRKLTLAGDTQMWTPTFSRKQMAFEFRNITMGECMDCHQLRRVEMGCSSCHKDIDIPDTHFEETFGWSHGLQAYDDLLGCDSCHSWTREKTGDPDQLLYGNHPARDYARINRFCTECHLKRPERHDKHYRRSHAYETRARGIQGCQVCHNQQLGIFDQRGRENVSTVNCSDCHQGRHKSGWQNRHPVPVWGKGLERECFQCHGSRTCGQCHQL
jgi:hypothetical protein